jgi:hypothetical protein
LWNLTERLNFFVGKAFSIVRGKRCCNKKLC